MRQLHYNCAAEHNFGDFTIDASKTLTKQYELDNKPDSTLKYMKIMLAAKDSVFSQSKGQEFQQYAFKEIQRLQEISTANGKIPEPGKNLYSAGRIGRLFTSRLHSLSK